MYQIFFRDCNAVCMYLKQEVVLEPENGNMLMRPRLLTPEKIALSQHVMNFDHKIDWDNIKIPNSESHAYRHN